MKTKCMQVTFANSADPDEVAHNEPSHLDLHCLLFCSCTLTDTLFAIMNMSKFKGGRVHFRYSEVKGLKSAEINSFMFIQ